MTGDSMGLRKFFAVLGVAFVSSAFAVDFNVDSIEKLLRNDPSIHTAEDLLSKLPDDLRTGPVLMYKSNSLQSASAEYPRAILFPPPR